MDDITLRLECAKLAASAGSGPFDIANNAAEIYAFVLKLGNWKEAE